MDIKKEYERWLANATADADVVAELKTLDDAKIEDAFYRDLAFGTGGLRGVIGAGTNRMNIYTVAKASQGLADYLKKNFETPSVAIGYDSRIKSDVFAKVAAGVFAANGVKVNIWPVLMPVPTVSFATRYLHTSAGVMVTASHNPSKYNGYKVYGADGCQITTEAAAEILAEIEKLDIFADVKTSDFDAGVANGSIQYIPDSGDRMKNKNLGINSLLNVIKATLSIIFPLITYPYAIRVLGTEGVGKVSYANSIVSYFALVAMLGMVTYGIREGAKVRNSTNKLQKLTNELFSINLLSTVVAYTGFIICLIFVPQFVAYRIVLVL